MPRRGGFPLSICRNCKRGRSRDSTRRKRVFLSFLSFGSCLLGELGRRIEGGGGGGRGGASMGTGDCWGEEGFVEFFFWIFLGGGGMNKNKNYREKNIIMNKEVETEIEIEIDNVKSNNKNKIVENNILEGVFSPPTSLIPPRNGGGVR